MDFRFIMQTRNESYHYCNSIVLRDTLENVNSLVFSVQNKYVDL